MVRWKGARGMERVPVLWNGRAVGELTASDRGLYVDCRARCFLPEGTLGRLYAVGEAGEVRLGVPEPGEAGYCLRRSLSRRELNAAGPLLRGELRTGPADESPDGWRRAPAPEGLFRSGFLRRELRGCRDVLTREQDGIRYVALPFDCRRPFLMTGFFCFARVRRIGGREYAVFAFDRDEFPVFR